MLKRENLPKIWVYCLLVVSVLALFVFIYFVFLKSYEVIDIGLDTRDMILDLTMDEEHRLDDYESMIYANNMLSYNTCENEIRVLENPHSWSRDWIYLMLFDNMYSEMTGSKTYLEESQILKNSLYEQFSTDGLLELYTLWGLESYCLPYYTMNKLRADSANFEYTETFDLAESMCFDFYDIEIAEARCENGENCIEDEEFYALLENLFENGSGAKNFQGDDFSYFDDFYQNKIHPINSITDEFIVAYEHNSKLFVEDVNSTLFNGIHYFQFTEDFLVNVQDSPCLDNYAYYIGLLKAMYVKKGYLNDPSLIQRHEYIENALFSTCEPYYNDVLEDLLFKIDFLGDKIELYYLFEKELGEDFLDNLVKDSLEKNLVYKRINGQRYPLLDPVVVDSSGANCFDVEIDLTKNLKSSFYILYFNAFKK